MEEVYFLLNFFWRNLVTGEDIVHGDAELATTNISMRRRVMTGDFVWYNENPLAVPAG